LVLKYVIDAILQDKKTFPNGPPSLDQTYLLIGLYIFVKFFSDFLGYLREIPYARMAANAEISISHDVYDHVQR
jgi:hypothetical protein